MMWPLVFDAVQTEFTRRIPSGAPSYPLAALLFHGNGFDVPSPRIDVSPGPSRLYFRLIK